MDNRVFGISRERIDTLYGSVDSFFSFYMNEYVRVYVPGGMTSVGKVVYVDEVKMLLCPTVVNCGTRRLNELKVNQKVSSVVSLTGAVVEGMDLNDQEGAVYLERIVNDFNSVAKEESLEKGDVRIVLA